MRATSSSGGPTVAVVGGGASGTLVCLHLLAEWRRRQGRGRILLVDREGRHARGRAYGTTDQRHLLNAPAGRMSAYAGDPGHFARWAAQRITGAGQADFLPRAVYGDYLAETLADAELAGWPHVRTERVADAVTWLDPPGPGRAVLRLAGGGELHADAVVLATGEPAPDRPVGLPAGVPYVPDAWAPGALDGLTGAQRVLVVGAGLTMFDIALSLAGAGTRVHAVSRTGLLPRPHATAGSAAPVRLVLPDRPAGLGQIVHAVRLAVEAAGGDWMPVIDALRPHVPELWMGLSAPDQRRFLALLARPWEVHRHRIPPLTAERVTTLRDKGHLQVHRGRLAGVGPAQGPQRWCATLAHAEHAYSLPVDAIVNATGAGSTWGDPLLAGLFRTGLARPDHLGLGVDAMPDGAVRDRAGNVQTWLSAVGPLLRGMRWESTAVPEIRDQAAALAYRLTRPPAPTRTRAAPSRLAALA